MPIASEMPHAPPARLPRRARYTALQMAALLIAVLAGAAQAQWVWRDQDGQVNASDRPPPRDVPEKNIMARPTPETRQTNPLQATDAAASAASAPAGITPPLPDRELQARRRNAEQEQAAKARADEERLALQRADNCRNARGHLAAMESGQRMARFNDKGEREILDDHGRAEEVRRTREVIASDCR